MAKERNNVIQDNFDHSLVEGYQPMRIVLAGYYGFNNLGDDWSLEIILDILKKHTDQITVLSNQPDQTKLAYQVKSVSRWKPIKIVNALVQNDLLLIGGGSIIQDMSGFFSPLYYLGLIALAKLLGKKVFMISQGFGPIQHKFNDLLCQLILPWVDRIIARDHESLLAFQQLGVADNKVCEAADLVWLKKVTIKQANKNKWLVILRSDWLDHQLPHWLNKLQQLAKENKKILAFLPIGNQGDEALIEKIKTSDKNHDCLFYTKSQWEQAFDNVELVISMRYHGLLLGALSESVLIGIGQDSKIINLLNELNQISATQENIITTIMTNHNQISQYQSNGRTIKQEMNKKAKLNLFHLQTFLLSNSD